MSIINRNFNISFWNLEDDIMNFSTDDEIGELVLNFDCSSL